DAGRRLAGAAGHGRRAEHSDGAEARAGQARRKLAGRGLVIILVRVHDEAIAGRVGRALRERRVRDVRAREVEGGRALSENRTREVGVGEVRVIRPAEGRGAQVRAGEVRVLQVAAEGRAAQVRAGEVRVLQAAAEGRAAQVRTGEVRGGHAA